MQRAVRIKHISVIGLTLVMLGIVLLPVTEGAFFSPSFCIHHQLLGVQCPGCGITRGIHSFFHGHWHAAYAYNPAIFILIVYFLFFFVEYFRPTALTVLLKKWSGRLLVVALAVVYILRWVHYLREL